jgi:hypothetical protein
MQSTTQYTRQQKTAVKEFLKEELPDGYGQDLKGMRLFTRYRRVRFER